MTAEAPGEVVSLAEQRARARVSKDFAAADDIRDRIAELGWNVVDEPGGGWRLEPASPATPAAPEEGTARTRARDVDPVLDRAPAFDATLHWIVEGWPEDVERGIGSFRAHAAGRSLQFVVTDVAGEDSTRWGDDVEVLSLEEGTDRKSVV